MNRTAFKILVLGLIVFGSSLFMSSKVFGQAIIDVNNQLLNATQADNFVYSPPDFAGSKYDDDGYLTVGVGEFQRYNLVMTFDSPTPSIQLDIIDATVCGAIAPGDYTEIDNPSDTGDSTTYIAGGVLEPAGGTTLADHWQVVGAGYDCANRNRSIFLNNLTLLSDGRYGGYFYAVMTNRPGSHQNSFKMSSPDPSVNIGYVSEVVQRLRNWVPNSPFLSFVGLTAGQQVGISLTNVAQPRYAYTNFNLGMAVPCNSLKNNFSTVIGIFDMDDPSGASTEPAGVSGGYWQGTALYPTARLVVYERQIGTAGWGVITNAPIQGPGSGRGSEFQVPVGPFRKGYQYQFELQNISRANAVQFSILDQSADLSTTAYEQPCGESPVGFADDCEVIGNQTIIYGWGYDNDDAGAPSVRLDLSGASSQTITANLSTYASWQSSAAINSYLNASGYQSDARDNKYGWSAAFDDVLTGGDYNLSGAVINAGLGNNPDATLGINGGVFGAGGSLPDRCKFTPTPPTADLKINDSDGPLSIVEGSNVNVSWTSTDATSCTAARSPQSTSTWSGVQATSSTGEEHNADSSSLGTFVYSISCSGLGGTASDSVTLIVRQVPSKPYLQVLNGDVSAGTGFGTSCVVVPTAPIAAFNNGTPGYLGASTRLASFDLGAVTGFSSGIANPGVSKPKDLTFANSGAGAANSEYGGGLGSNSCAIDYYNLPKTAANAWGGSLVNGEWTAAGAQTLAAGGPVTIAPNNKVTLFVNGNVYIRNNILLGAASSYNSMPTFYLIAQGDIYIDYRVTQLDGIYVAQGGSGKIFTCTIAASAPVAQDIASTSYCGQNQLTVNGALLARQVKLLRSRGKVENCTDLANCLSGSAEVINYSPDTWIPPRAPVPPGAKKYDAITSLPPVL